MYRPRIHWKPSSIKLKPMWQRFSLKWLLLALIGLLLLWGLHHQLSKWDGIVIPEHDSNEVPHNEIAAYKKSWLEFGYNAWLADRIPVKRELPDVRDERCLNISYNNVKVRNMEVAIIVIFRNEQLSMLLRTLHSIRDRTNQDLINEFIVINDHSDVGFWKEELSKQAFNEYVKRHIFGEARIFHFEEQIGLVRARRFAATEAEYDYLVYLDAQVEVTEGWLVPLLHEISLDKFVLAVPQLDQIDEETLEYERGIEKRGVFDWSLRRREVPLLWQQLNNLPQPFFNPVPHLSVFVVNGDWFNSLAHFDMELNSPAAAELELSFQMWLEFAHILQVPCSRVAHLQPSNLNYMQRYGDFKQLEQEHFKSYKRLVEIWINDPKYKSVVYQHLPQVQQANMGNISEQLAFIKEENLHSFNWFLENVATDLLQHFPLKPPTDFANGTLRPFQLNSHCLTGNKATNRITLEPCAPSKHVSQYWTLTSMNDLRLGDNYCVEVLPNRKLALNRCHIFGGRQSWVFDIEDNSLVSNTHCLEFGTQNNIKMRDCNSLSGLQMWYFEHVNLEAIKANSLDRGKF